MSTEIVGSDFAEFPAITICPEHKRAFKNEILQQFNLTAKDIRNFIFPSNGMKSQDFYDLITHNLTELITEMKISMVKPISGTKYTIVKMTDKITAKMSDHRIFTQLLNEKDFIKQNYHTLGTCYTYEMPEIYKKSKVNNIELTMKMNGLIYFLHPGQFFWVDRDTKIPLNIEETNFISVHHQLTYSRQKWSPDPTLHLICKEEMNYRIDSCLRSEFDKNFMEKFGCFYPMFSAQNETSKFCDIADLTDLELEEFRILFHGKVFPSNYFSFFL